MLKILCSTGAIIGRANGRDFNLLKNYAPRIECDGFELMFYSDWYRNTDALVDTVNSIGVPFPAFHCDKQIGELLTKEDFSEAYRLFEINCRTAQKISARILVLHLWNGIISDSNIDANISAYPTLMDIAGNYGLTLTAENVLAYYHTPLEIFYMLKEKVPDAKFTYDTKMADFDNENAVAFDSRHKWLWESVRHLHINDRAGGYRDWSSIRALHPGEGQIDFDEFFHSLLETGYNGDCTVEAASLESDGRVRIDKMNESIRKVREWTKREKQFKN